MLGADRFDLRVVATAALEGYNRTQEMGFVGAKVPCPYGPSAGDEGFRKNVEFCKKWREAVGPEFPLSLDCYMSLTVPYAIKLGQELLRPCGSFVHVGISCCPLHSTNWNRISGGKELAIYGSSLGVGYWKEAIEHVRRGNFPVDVLNGVPLSPEQYISFVAGEDVPGAGNAGVKRIVSRYSPAMPYTCLGDSVRGMMSRLVFGTLSLWQLPQNEAFDLLDHVTNAGCNTLECARIYGSGASERVIGEYFRQRPGKREDVVLVTKGGCMGREGRFAPTLDRIELDLRNSLDALGTPIDLYMLHRDDGVTDVAKVAMTMTTFVRNGWIRAYGVSNWSFARLRSLKRAAEERDLVAPIATSPYFSLATVDEPMYDNTSFLGQNKTLGVGAELRYYVDNGVHVLCWAALAKGFFTCDSSTFAEDKPGDSDVARFINSRYRLLKNEENLARKARLADLCARRGLDRSRATAGLLVEYVLRKSVVTHAIIGTRSQMHFDDAIPRHKLSPAEVKYLEGSMQ